MSVACVTGAAGFIGRRLCARLAARGDVVVAVLRRETDGPWQRSAIADLAEGPPPAGALQGVEIVYHLAGRTHALAERGAGGGAGRAGIDEAYRRVNVDGTRRVLDAAIAAGARRFVFASSVKAMGEGGDGCLDESAAPRPTTPYGRTKLEAESLVHAAGQAHGLHTVVLRLPLVYGRGSKGNLARMFERVRRGRFPALPDTANRRLMVHVDDVVEAALLAGDAACAAGRTYLVTDGEARSTREVHALMCAVAGRPAPGPGLPLAGLRAVARIGDAIGVLAGRRAPFDSDALDKLVGSAWYDSGRIERELGFRPAHTLEVGLREMAAAGEGT